MNQRDDDLELSDFPLRLDIGKFKPTTRAELAGLKALFSSIRVLVVVDSDISISDANPFGVSRFIRFLRETTIGCAHFTVDVARRTAQPFADNGTAPAGQARYDGFRFDSQVAGKLVLNRYDELFLFGFKPGNDKGPDSNIHAAPALPASDSELARLTDWMNGGGGVFATGDHDYLGASMCHRIPRVGTMRKWTNAQGVPPIDTAIRLDTNQPATLAQRIGWDEIPISVEEDHVPQPIEWVPERWWRAGLVAYKQPHELLCHPKLGPIDVMPDHPHEGCCIESHDIDETATLNFGEGVFDEYPAVDGHREKPKIIAYGHVVPDPPFKHEKGEVKPFTIPMINAYDGWAVKVGRVVSDSTWHHWFSMNIEGLEAAADKTAWEKISRYYLNVAKWIARPGRYRVWCWWEILFTHYDYPGIEEYGSKDRLAIGGALLDKLNGIHGPCSVTELVLETLCELHPALCGLAEREIIPRRRPDPCLTCPPFDVIERVVLGGFVEGTRRLAQKLGEAIDAGKTEGLELEAAEIERAAMAGAAKALARFSKEVAASAERLASVLRESPAGLDTD